MKPTRIIYSALLLISLFSCQKESDDILFSIKVDYNANYGNITVSPMKTAYQEGDTVFVSATPNSGYVFSSWKGDVSGTSSTIKLVMTQDFEINCIFRENEDENTSTTLFEFQGIFQQDKNNWKFTARIFNKNSGDAIEGYKVEIDGKSLEYIDFYGIYESVLEKEDNNSPFEIKIKYSDIIDKSFSVTPANFPPKDNISATLSDDKKSFTADWIDVNADYYRIYKKLLAKSTTCEISIGNIYNKTQVELTIDDIWNSNIDASQNFETFWVWVTPVKAVKDMGDGFTDDSFIEILGHRTSVIEKKR